MDFLRECAGDALILACGVPLASAFGRADYDPQQDSSVSDTVQRADKMMYENKRVQKAGRSVR